MSGALDAIRAVVQMKRAVAESRETRAVAEARETKTSSLLLYVVRINMLSMGTRNSFGNVSGDEGGLLVVNKLGGDATSWEEMQRVGGGLQRVRT